MVNNVNTSSIEAENLPTGDQTANNEEGAYNEIPDDDEQGNLYHSLEVTHSATMHLIPTKLKMELLA